MYSRRHFLKTSAAAASQSRCCTTSITAGLHRHTGQELSRRPDTGTPRLAMGWEYLQGSLGGPWEVWHSEEVASWQPVAMPHCFNAYDACDPDVPYYRGNGWYRTHVPDRQPLPKAAAPCCTLKAQARRPPSTSEKHSSASTSAATTNSSSTSPTFFLHFSITPHHRESAPSPVKKPSASPSPFSATTPAISTACPPTSATSASTAACIVTSISSTSQPSRFETVHINTKLASPDSPRPKSQSSAPSTTPQAQRSSRSRS